MKHNSPVLTAFNPYTKDPFIRFFAAPADATTPAARSEPSDDGQADGGNGSQPTPPTPGQSNEKGDKANDEDEALGEGGKKALQSEREARKQLEREIAELRSKNKEFEDASKSAEEKQAERLAELEKSSTTNALRVMQYEVAAEKGLPLSAATRLTGDTKEALEADADELQKLIGASAPAPPKPDPSQGHGSTKAKPKTLGDAVHQHYS